MKVAAVFLLLIGSSASSLTTKDFARALAKQPRPSLTGHDFTSMVGALNEQLEAAHGVTKPCSDFTLAELNDLLAALLSHRSHELSAAYSKGSGDGRALRFDSEEAARALWDEEAALLRSVQHQQAADGVSDGDLRELSATHSELSAITRDGKCHEAVLVFIHHLSAAGREAFHEANQELGLSLVLPLLPDTHHKARLAGLLLAASTATASASASASAAATRLKATAAVAGTYGDVSSCAPGHITTNTSEVYEPACLGVGGDECPVWPAQFSAPFGLYSKFPKITNATSVFYYKVTASEQKQVVDYGERCFPFLGGANNKNPCKLYFQSEGIFLSQPSDGVPCCLAQEGVSAAPLQFLHSFTRTGQNVTAPDLYGNQVLCDHWEGPSNFEYWTVGKDDPLYKNTGHDIVFKDGPSGVTWRWGNFDVSDQDESIFTLPAPLEQCLTPC